MTGTITPTRPTRRGSPSDRERSRPAEQGGEDPRFARRRKEVAAAGRRRRRIALIVLAVVVCVAAAVFGLLRSPLLDVDRILVAGSNSIDRDQVVEASEIGRGDALIDIDIAAARASVMDVPGVASARVELDWPSTVRISVTDEQPLAVLGVGERRVVVARGGRVLAELPAEEQPVLPLIAVAETGLLDGLEPGRQVPDALMDVVVVLEQVPEPLGSRLGGVDVGSDGTLTLQLTPGEGDSDNGGEVAFGRPEDVPSKLLAVASMLAAANVRCLDVLDVREPLRPTISRRDGCDPGPATVGATTTVPAPTTTTPTTKGATSTTSTGGGG